MLLLLFFVVRPFISVSFLLSSCSHIVNFKNKNRNCHLQSRTVQTCCPYSYRYRKQWDIKLEAQGWKIGHRLRYSARSLQWTMICRVKNDMWAGLFSVRVWNIVTALQASVIVGFLITDFKQIFNILKLLQQMSYMCNFHITPTVPFLFFFLTHFATVSIHSVSHLQTHLRGIIPLAHNPLSTLVANNNHWS